MHEDHRKRVRERFLAAGLDSFPPHNVLELLLFYAIPQRDTNEIAHRLIDRFGSLSGVLEAAPEELCKVKGIGEYSATLICFAAQLAKRYLAEQGKERRTFESSQELRRYAAALFVGIKTEATFILCLDNAGQLLHCCKVSLGTRHSVSLDDRTLLETAFRYNATKVILAHNHPNGLAAPSPDDVRRTESAAALFGGLQIHLLDHLIVAGQECFSMAAHPKFARIFLKNIVPFNQQIAADVT